ncbi:Dyp-type peroxidase [Flavitalea sp.]|nr:Dyp-type peroxidase [Flavitalea sp.]
MNHSQNKPEDLSSFFLEMDKQINDVQGLIRRGYKSLPAAQFLLLRIEDGTEAKKYFNLLADSFITSSNKPKTGAPPNYFDDKKAVQIAFTSSGLKQLGLAENILSTFSREFIEGMSFSYPDPHNPGEKIRERSILLGDVKSSDPKNWHWGNEDQRVDAILLLYAETKEALEKLRTDCYESLQKGLSLVYNAETYPYNPKEAIREHFGFSDGISQPIIKGFKKSAEASKEQLLNPGDIILGHKNEYGSFSPSPWFEENGMKTDLDPVLGFNTRKDLGKNGSYLVFRQMEQHVESFYHFVFTSSKEIAADPDAKAIKLAAKMVGRWPEGQSLAVCPELPCKPDHDLNNFLYYEADKAGTGCPFGAHVRRTNPRDQVHAGRDGDSNLSLAMSKKHRILRRGRIYGEPLGKELKAESILKTAKNNAFKSKWIPNENAKTNINRGIHFMCFVSDLSRQFEFIQSVWSNTSSFAELNNEVDPIISPRPTPDQRECHEFTTPQAIVRNRYKNVPEFTTVVGGAYFFMPGIRALKFILK